MTIEDNKQYYYIENGMAPAIIDINWLISQNYIVFKSVTETERFFTVRGSEVKGEILFELERVL